MTLPNGTFFANRVVLDLKGSSNRSAAIMIGKEGDVIVGTANWGEEQAKLLKGPEEKE